MTPPTDAALESRLRRTFTAVAEHTSISEHPVYAATSDVPRRRVRWAPAPALAAAVVVAVAVLGVVLTGGDGRTGPGPAANPPAVTPPGAPAVLGGPLFAADGDAPDVAQAYLRSRFPDYPDPDVEIQGVQVNGARAVADWSTALAYGTLSMVRSDGGWTVTASSTADVEVLGPTLESGRLRVTFQNRGQETLIVDVLGTDGRTLFVAAGPSYVIDLPGVQEPVVLRARLMGGTVLGITELWVRPETARHLTVAEGTWTGGNWTLVRSDNCAWVELDLGPIAMTCDYAPVTSTFSVLGPVGRVDEDTLHFGVVGPDVVRVRTLLADGQVIDHVPVEGLTVFVAPSDGVTDIVLLDAADRELHRQPTVPGGPIGG